MTRDIRPGDPAATARAAEELGTAFPPGYADVVERYGEGTTCGFFRVFVPDEVVTRTREWRDTITDSWFWDTGDVGLEPEDFHTRGVLFADTFGGDQYVFLAGDPDRCFMLAHEDEEVWEVARGLVGVVRSFTDDAESPPPTFEASVARRRRGLRSADPVAAVRDAVVALGIHDLVHTQEGWTQVFVQGPGAVISFEEARGGSGTSVTVGHGEAASADALDRLLTALASVGVQ